MANIFFISDTHFGHANSLVFTNYDGSKLRDFSSVEEMDEHMVERWNAVVREQDTVYHLGDVVIAKKNLEIVKRLKGKLRLIRGNHDIFKTKDYIEAGFKEIRGVHVMNDFILSHIPLHPDCITERFKVNVHGHLHANRIKINKRGMVTDEFPDGITVEYLGNIEVIDPRYFCVCVEQIEYTPMDLESVRENIRRQQ